MHATCPCPCNLASLNNSNNIWQGLQAMKVLVMQFSPASFYFTLVQFKYSP
jgi:hypothetical protein